MKVFKLFTILFLIASSLQAQLPPEYKNYIKRSAQENPSVIIAEVEKLDNNNISNQVLLAELNYYGGNNEIALSILEKSINQLTSSEKKNSYLYARALSTNGLILWNEGKTEKAANYLKEALKIQKIIAVDSITLSETYNNLGLVTNVDDPILARTYFQQAIDLIAPFKSVAEKMVYTTINIALLDIQDKSYKDALRRLNITLTDWKKTHSTALPIEAFILLNLGEIYAQLKDYVLAKEHLMEAIAIYEDFYGKRNSELANAYMLLGRIYLNEGHFSKALVSNQKALIANSIEFNDTNIEINPKIDDALKPSYQMAILTEKAIIFEKYYFGYSLKKNHLINALKSLQAADKLVGLIRNNTSNKSDQLSLNKNAARIYETGQRLCFYLADITLLDKGYLNQAFEFSEKAKASSLLNAITESNAKEFANIPKAKLQEELALKNTISYFTTALAKSASSAEQTALHTELFNAQKVYDNFIKNLEESYPEYYNLKFNNQAATIQDIQESINQNELLISYSIDEESQRIYQYLIGKNSFNANIIHNYPELQRTINAYRNILTYKVIGPYQDISYKLYESLIPRKIASDIEKLIIIPEAELGVIPFEAFTSQIIDTGEFEKFSYLIKKYAISYDYSATLRTSSKALISNEKTLVIAPITFNDKKLNALPASEKEANVISELFTTKSYQNTKLTFNEATEGNFKKQYTSGYEFIHLATHGLVNPIKPDLSAIYLNNDPDSTSDGRLYVGEIYNLSFKSNLLCLSACETGIGKYSKGEGILGLGRAFSYAGANQIIVSLWKVSDNSTAELMQDFYKNSLNDQKADYVTGIQKAKLGMIQSKYSNPFYWAPFVLWGK